MNKKINLLEAQDLWRNLSQFTTARIGLGRAGTSLPTKPYLEFQLAHAQARDAVNIPLDFDSMVKRINKMGYQTQLLETQAENQVIYLQRPDLGRLLPKTLIKQLHQQKKDTVDVVIIIVDGLSSKAIKQHAENFLALLLRSLENNNYHLAPICLVKHGRVAVGDVIAETYEAKLCIVLIGERPGLSSPDSMGIYFTYQAKSGISTDADRNCISNIHANGLSYEKALKKLLFLIHEAETKQYSGVNLKDETTDLNINDLQQKNFLLF